MIRWINKILNKNKYTGEEILELVNKGYVVSGDRKFAYRSTDNVKLSKIKNNLRSTHRRYM